MNEPQPHGELEFRDKQHGVEIRSVSFPERVIEAIVMPYEEETLVEHRGRMVTEIISKGAFSGIQRRKIKANRDHDITKVVGHCVGLHPNRDEGLVAEIKIADVPEGDNTLTLCKDGLLDLSAGFMPINGGEQWETRDRRRITKAWLGHVAFVPEPAYDGARVLAVRQKLAGDPTGTSAGPRPNLDKVRAILLEQAYAELTGLPR